MRFLRRSLVGLFLLSLTLGLLAWAGILVRDAVQAYLTDTPRIPQARERVFAVNVVPVRLETVAPVMTAFGEIQSRRTLELRSAVGGTLIDLAPEFVEGGRVAAGTLLARIDPADMQAELERAQSALHDAEAERREAIRAVELEKDALAAAEEQAELRQRAYQRQADLQSRGVGTSALVEEAELSASSARQAVVTRRQALAQAEARVDQSTTSLTRAHIALDEAQRRLDETEIRAGFDAQLEEVSVVGGRRVSANEMLATLVDPTALEVAFRVSTQQYLQLLNASDRPRELPVTVTLDFYGASVSSFGTLTREGAAVGEGQTGRLLFAALETPRGFKPGDFVTVTIDESPLEQVALLPATALGPSGDVLVLDGEERLEAISVELLRRQGDSVIIRAPGLDGRLVVAERTPLLGAGIKVRPLDKAATSGPTGPDVQAEAAMLELTEERRARLVAFIEGNDGMPAEAKQRLLAQILEPRVPAQVIERLEARMGG
ncbi:efflux RND transporter periplasmic adaptor subunit [Alloyangia pacifica]|uniref:Multidrug resistance efflux pump n=1 Tax=Alloyangia pacifica TaxID=311180 RepID=A0A1I6WIG1_9RHOB|nr:HlyD family efflux transporter periplasmic adaptor subunit [Alloyangia pacifica]SDI79391.1 Multidrug resistance efflux pump [Alloyangia pacifica]SFT25765.1 Multidrug resistance efflux pump [Alloyangia pacifica]